METHVPNEQHANAQVTENSLLENESDEEGPRYPTSAVTLMSTLSSRSAKQRRLHPSAESKGNHDDYQEDVQDWHENQKDLRIEELENGNNALRRELTQLRFQVDAGNKVNGQADVISLPMSLAQVNEHVIVRCQID